MTPTEAVRHHANAGRYTEAADAWTRHLAAVNEDAYQTWGRALDSTIPGVKDNAKKQAMEAQHALTEWRTAAGNDPSLAVGRLLVTLGAGVGAA